MAWTLLKQSYLSFPPHPLFDTLVYDSPGTVAPKSHMLLAPTYIAMPVSWSSFWSIMPDISQDQLLADKAEI